MDIEVRIRGLMMDPATNMPIVVLKDVASETVMPIWVGIFEANAIAIEIEKMAAPRPMTHDLTKNLIRHLNASWNALSLQKLRTRPSTRFCGCGRAMSRSPSTPGPRMRSRWRCAPIVPSSWPNK